MSPRRKARAKKFAAKRTFDTKRGALIGGDLCICGKAPFSRSGARQVMKKMTHRNSDAHPLNVYECLTVPGIYHIGHVSWRYPPDPQLTRD